MTIACGVMLAVLSVWDYPERQQQHEMLKVGFVAALQQGRLADMETAARRGTELLPEDPVWRYNLACAEAKAGRKEAALKDLEKAIVLGFRDPGAIEEDADFKAFASDAEFVRLVNLAERLQDVPLTSGPLATVTEHGSLGGEVTLGAHNLAWNLDDGCFVAKLELSGKVAGGNAGDLYVNRDAGHSVLKVKDYPGLTRVSFDAEGHARGADLDFPNTSFPCPVFGNCSRALTQGPYWRSIPRAMVTTMASRQPLYYKFYRENQVWVFPAVNDCEPLGKHGDVFASVTPYCIATQGKSWSDLYYLKAALDVSAALPREVKREAVARKLLAPTVQALIRRSLKGVETEADYLSAKAHPTAFPAEGLDLPRLRAAARALTVETLPPVALIAGFGGSKTVYRGKMPELTYVTPCAWAFVLREPEDERVFIVKVAGGDDYAFASVHGDPAAVRIERLASDQVKITVDRTKLTPTNRADVAVFAKSKASDWGAPSFLSFAVVDPKADYVDPLLLGIESAP